MGRFMTPDWAAKPTAVPYASFGNPQSLNLYSYVKNNPITTRDPDGHCDICLSVALWAAQNMGLEGPKQFAKDVAVGAAKGAGQFVYKGASMVVAGGNPGAQLSAALDSGPKGLQPSNQVQSQSSAVTQVALGAASAAVGSLGDAEATTTVMHFTDDAGKAAISSSRFVKADSFVTLPSEIPEGASSSTVQHLLTLDPGKGANSITFDTPSANLRIPFNGPKTDGGALQFQLNNPAPIDPTKFKPTVP